MNVLLAVDTSPESLAALDILERVHWPVGSSLFLLYVIEPNQWAEGIEGKSMIHLRSILSSAKSKEVEKAWKLLRKLLATIQAPKVTVTPLVRDGIPGKEILSAISKNRIDLAVLGTRGRTGLKRFLLGSVSEWVLTEAPCSVLIVRKGARSKGKAPKGLHLVLGADGSPDSKAALEFVHHWKFAKPSRVTLVHVQEKLDALQTELSARLGVTGHAELTKFASEVRRSRQQEGQALLKKSANQLKRQGLRVKNLLLHGHPADQILKVTQSAKPDLLVVGSRGLTGLRRLFLGSVSHNLVEHAPCSVLIVRKPKQPKRRQREK